MIGFWTPGPIEIVTILGLALLLFGKRLPEVGRSLGRGIVEFKKGVKGIEDEIETTTSEVTRLPSPDPHEDDPCRPLEKGGDPPAPEDVFPEVSAEALPPDSEGEPETKRPPEKA